MSQFVVKERVWEQKTEVKKRFSLLAPRVLGGKSEASAVASHQLSSISPFGADHGLFGSCVYHGKTVSLERDPLLKQIYHSPNMSDPTMQTIHRDPALL